METEKIIQLVEKMKQGDTQAFADLYDAFADKIHRYISIKISDSQTREDILQEVFVKVWQAKSQFSSKNLNFSAWLYRVASNTVNDYYRKVYRRPITRELDQKTELPSGEDIAGSLQSRMDSELVHGLLKKLPEHYRQVLELRYIQEFSIIETARILNKSSIAVRVLQHRALKKLELLFKKYAGKIN